MILIVDNYDSFVFNVSRSLVELGHETRVERNDRITVEEVRALAPRSVVISPGPCAPDSAGISTELVIALSGRVPILGICLGHQCIGAAFGGRIERAHRPLHGRRSDVQHDGEGLFAGLPSPLGVGRYHSLVVRLGTPTTSPLRATAWSEEGEIMALTHRTDPTYGVQFHPESILTEDGHAMLSNFLALSEGFWRDLA